MTKIKIAGMLIFIMSLALAGLFRYTSEQTRLNSEILERINKQKAFTQEISKNIFYIYKNGDSSVKQLDKSIKNFIAGMENRHEILEAINSPEINAKSEEIVKVWNTFYLMVQEFRDNNKVTAAYSSILLDGIVKDIYNTNFQLVAEFNKLIELHHAHLDEKLESYRDLQYVLFFLLVGLLIYFFTQLQTVIAFIQKFLSTSKEIVSNSSIKELQPIETKASSGDVSEASNNFNFLLQKINDAIAHSSDSVEHSCQTFDAVEENIENLLELISAMDEDDTIDRELTKKEDALIESLEELSNAAQKLKALKTDLDAFIHHKNITKMD